MRYATLRAYRLAAVVLIKAKTERCNSRGNWKDGFRLHIWYFNGLKLEPNCSNSSTLLNKKEGAKNAEISRSFLEIL